MECYKIMTNPTDGLVWSTAQEYCGYSMSNLIVIPTEAIFTVIQAYAVNVSVEKFWIGLNDIETENTIEWIDDTTLYPNSKLQTSSISETNDCVIQDTTKANWEFRHCTREKFSFVCQRKKVGETKFFRIPEAVDKDKKNGSHQFPWAVSLGAGGAALIIILILVFCVRKVQISRNNNYLPGQGEVDRLTLENTERNRLANQRRASNSKETGFSNSPPSYDDHMGNTRPSLY
eukprot:XP_019923482.1 PREDICTED: uncharacterized protein LOC105329838 isoform X2 [Crassostrea gigas]